MNISYLSQCFTFSAGNLNGCRSVFCCGHCWGCSHNNISNALSLSLCIVVYNVTLSPRLDEPVGYFLEPPVRVKVSESSRRNFQGLEAHLFTLSVNLWAGSGWVERNGWKSESSRPTVINQDHSSERIRVNNLS